MRRTLQVLGLGIFVAALLLPAAPAHGAAPVTCGMEVTTSIRLADDLSCAGDGLVVAAGGVTIDLNRHTLSGDGSGIGIGLHCFDPDCVGRSVRVVNGTVAGFASAIDGTTGSLTVSRVVLTGNDVGIASGRRLPTSFGGDLTVSASELSGNGTGISAVFGRASVRRTALRGNGTGIRTFGPHTLTLDQGVFTGNGSGVILFRSTAAITNSTFTDHTGTGVGASGGPAIAPVSITGSDFERNGIAVSRGASVDLSLTHNEFRDNDSSVFVAPGTPGAFVATDNRFTSNRTWGLFVENAFPDGALVARNRFADNDLGGLHLLGTAPENGPLASGVTVQGNVATGNHGPGLDAPLSIDGGGNRARGNDAPVQCIGVVCR